MKKVVLLKKLVHRIAELRRQDDPTMSKVSNIDTNDTSDVSSSADESKTWGSTGFVAEGTRGEISNEAEQGERAGHPTPEPARAELLRRLERGELTPTQERIARAQLGLATEEPLSASTEIAPISVSVDVGANAGAAGSTSGTPDRPLQSSYLVPDD